MCISYNHKILHWYVRVGHNSPYTNNLFPRIPGLYTSNYSPQLKKNILTLYQMFFSSTDSIFLGQFCTSLFCRYNLFYNSFRLLFNVYLYLLHINHYTLFCLCFLQTLCAFLLIQDLHLKLILLLVL